MTGTPLPQTTDIVLLAVTDNHLGQTANVEHVRTCFTWGFDSAAPVLAVLDAGDSIHGNLAGLLASEYPGTYAYLNALGNHDGNHPIDCPSGTVGPDPFSEQIARFPVLAGREWYAHDLLTLDGRPTHVRVVAVQNNIPSWNPATSVDNYYNVNPPGVQTELNPDHTGLTDPESPQRQFLAEAIQTAPDWCIVLAHRGFPGRVARDEHPRPLAPELAPLIPLFSSWRVSWVHTGDVHVGSYVRVPGERITWTSLEGSYATRSAENGVVPDGSLLWASGASSMMSGLCQIIRANINNDSCSIQIFECSDADPAGAVVFTDTFNRNGGVAGSLEG